MLYDSNLVVVGIESILEGDKFKTLEDIGDIAKGSIIEIVEVLSDRKSYTCNVNGVEYSMPINETVIDGSVFIR